MSAILRVTAVLFVFFSVFPIHLGHLQAADSNPEVAGQSVHQLTEYVVSDTRLPRDKPSILSHIPSNITVIKEADIERLGARTVQEALQFQMGVNLVDEVGNGFEQAIILRGFRADVNPVTVIVDGVRMNEPGFNQIRFDLVPIRDVERIEIRPGPSSIYGKNALGGVINFVTKRGKKEKEAEVDLAFGSYKRQLYRGSTSGSIQKFDYYLSGEMEDDDGFRQDASSSIRRFFSKTGYRPTDETDISLTFTSMNNDFQQPGSITQAELDADRDQASPRSSTDQQNQLNKGTIGIRQQLFKGLSVALNGFYYHQDATNLLTFSSGTSDRMSDIHSGGGTLQLTHHSQIWKSKNTLTAGGEFTRNDFDVTAAAVFLGVSTPTNQETGENIYGLFLQDSFDVLPEVTITGGVRSDWDRYDFTDLVTPTNNNVKSYNRVTPRAGINYRPIAGTDIFFGFSQGFRVPANDELFAFAPFGANPDLKPIKSNNYEVGARVQRGGFGGSIALFRADVDDDIFFFCAPGDCFGGQNRNIDKTRRQGMEVSVQARLHPLVDVFLNYTYTRATFETDFLTRSATTSNPQLVQSGDSIPMVPQNQAAFGINVHPIPGLTVSVSGLAVSSRVFFGDAANTQDPLPGYVVLNTRVAYERLVGPEVFGFPGILAGFFQINNMFDNEYNLSGRYNQDFLPPTFIPAPPINVYGGVSFTYNSGLS